MDFEKSSIERLKRTLYSRNDAVVPKEKRTPVGPRESDAPTDWGAPIAFDFSPEQMTKKNNSFFNKFLVGSVLFFLVSLGIALFIFFGGLNLISSNNVDVRITAPSSVSSGEETVVLLSVLNSNRTDMEEVSLFIDYPAGAESIPEFDGEGGKQLSREKQVLGTIKSGSASDYTLRLLLFGEKDAIKTFIFRIEYKVKGSNAVFSKEKTYDVIIGSSPILLNLSYPKEINSGQLITISVDVTSNSTVPLRDALIKMEYPYGFTYKSSNINPLRDNSIWDIGDLKNGDKKTLTISGILVGQNLEDRTFRIYAGTQNSATLVDFSNPLAHGDLTIGIRKSFFDLQVIPEEGGVTSVARPILSEIRWQNTLPDKIINNRIEAVLSGDALDRSRVSVNTGGFYKSVEDMIIWDKNTTMRIATILPGESGAASFSVTSLPNNVQTRSMKNPHIDVHVTMTGDRFGLNAEKISSSKDITIKITSSLGLSARSFRQVGPFTNTGPVPPQADKESTYTVTWTVTNTTNDLKDTVVSATLPSGVAWEGEIFPVGEKISFDSDKKIITWNIGNVASGTGFSNSPKEVSFKVGITPSINQVGFTPPLLTEINAIAIDTYTETEINATIPQVTTRFSDPGYQTGQETVAN